MGGARLAGAPSAWRGTGTRDAIVGDYGQTITVIWLAEDDVARQGFRGAPLTPFVRLPAEQLADSGILSWGRIRRPAAPLAGPALGAKQLFR